MPFFFMESKKNIGKRIAASETAYERLRVKKKGLKTEGEAKHRC